MLELALKAKLPLISVHTDDIVNVKDVLGDLAGSEFTEVEKGALSKIGTKGFQQGASYFFMLEPDAIDFKAVYTKCAEAERVVVLVNPSETSSLVFDAGPVALPKDMLHGFLEQIADEPNIPGLMSVLSGLSLKDVAEISRLCTAWYGSFTPKGAMDTRRIYINQLRGVNQVDTEYTYYDAPPTLKSWLDVDGEVFMKADVTPELIPRGLLFDGTPGTGKTMGAKYLANRLSVPLFRLDLGGLMGKYVGESENNLSTAIQQVDQAEPCILLLDEVEKVFQTDETSGVTSRLLSALLWWLQEHESRVLTVMTTNAVDDLPKELFRPGRIDDVVTFEGLDYKRGIEFMEELAKALNVDVVLDGPIQGAANALYHGGGYRSQAELTKEVHRLIKEAMVKGVSDGA